MSEQRAEPEPLTYDSDRLIREWRDRYTSRRTVSWQMLSDAEALVRDAIARELEQSRRQAKSDRELDLERRERDAAWARGLHDQQVDRLRRELAEARAKIDSLSSRQTLMREERETVEDGTIVRILAPTVPAWGDKNSPRPWRLVELDDVTLRLRMAGASDATEVRFKRDAIEACVPMPELALMPVSSDRSSPPSSPTRRRLRLPIATVAFLAVVLIGMVLR